MKRRWYRSARRFEEKTGPHKERLQGCQTKCGTENACKCRPQYVSPLDSFLESTLNMRTESLLPELSTNDNLAPADTNPENESAQSGLTLLSILREHQRLGFVRSRPRRSARRGSTHNSDTTVRAESLEDRVLLFAIGTRWSTTATNGPGLTQGDPATITWSIIPDGTPIGALGGVSGESTDPSNLVSYLNGIYGEVTADSNYTDEIWFGHMKSAFDRWSALSGVTYVYSAADDGASFTGSAGVLGVRGDVRIGGHRIDGNSGVLAYNFYPNNGDMVIDTTDTGYPSTGNGIRLRNVIAHETGHGLGLRHVKSTTSAFLLEASLSTSFDGPQLDDILGVQRNYGDFYEKNGGNDTAARATSLGTLDGGETISIGTAGSTTVVSPLMTDFVSIDDELDSDFFSFTVDAAATISLSLTPKGPTYMVGPVGATESSYNAASQSNLSLRLFDKNGSTLLATADNSGIGSGEAINSLSLPAAGTYYVKINGSTTDVIQLYQLDISHVGSSALSLSLNPPSLSEAGGTSIATGVVSRTGDVNSALVVSLTSSKTTEATVPATVTIPAGASSATFSIAAVDDDLVDGTQQVTIAASAGGYESVSGNISIMDNDVKTLTVVLNQSSISENGGSSAATGTVSRNTADVSSPLTIMLASSLNNRASVPVSVTIPAGASSTTFSVAAGDDSLVNGTQTITITASSAEYVDGTGTLSVTDDDVPALTVTISNSSISENAGANAATGTVSRNTTNVSSALVVSLASSLTNRATVPATVTIPAGAASATFSIDAEDNVLVDGTQTVTITASAANFVAGSGSIGVEDDEVPALTVTVSHSAIAEDAGTNAATGTVSRNTADVSSPLIVTLASDLTNKATVPTTVTIPAGAISATFPISTADDSLFHGTLAVTITASATNFVAGNSTISVEDDEVQTLTVIISHSGISENAGASAATGTVTRNTADVSSPLTVTLTSNDTTEVTVPTTVTIAAGQSSATFAVAAADDTVADGIQSVTIMASAANYVSGTQVLSVTDNDVLTPPGITGPSAVSASLRPQISWTGAQGAASVEIWIKNQSTNTNPWHTANATGNSYIPTSDLGIGTFNLWTRSKAPTGNTAWTTQRNFTVSTPVVLNAMDRHQTVSRPTISWAALPGAVKYDIWIDDFTNGTSQYIRNQNFNGTSFTPGVDLPLGTYRVWVRGIAQDGMAAGWSAMREFIVATPPTVTSGHLPTFDRTPTLGWDAVSGAVRYEVFVRDMATGTTIYNTTNLTSTSWTPPVDLPVGQFRWWVLAVGQKNVRSLWTSPVDIFVGGRANVLTPSGTGNSSTPEFTWQAVEGAQRYELWVTNLSSMNTVIHRTDLTSPNYTHSTALSSGNYRIWVRAVSVSGIFGIWSLARDFSVAANDSPDALDGSFDEVVGPSVRIEDLFADQIRNLMSPGSPGRPDRVSPVSGNQSTETSAPFLIPARHGNVPEPENESEPVLAAIEMVWQHADDLMDQIETTTAARFPRLQSRRSGQTRV